LHINRIREKGGKLERAALDDVTEHDCSTTGARG
jgi:hypothetical protein